MRGLVATIVGIALCAGGARADTLEGEPDLLAVDVVRGLGIAVGREGAVWQLDPNKGAWTLVRPMTKTDLVGVDVVDRKDVWVVGIGGLYLHYDGSEWTAPPGGTSKGANAIGLATRKRGIALGAKGHVLHWLGSGWQSFSALTAKPTFRAVARVGRGGAERFVAVGDGGVAVSFSGVGRSLGADLEVTGVEDDLVAVAACDSRKAEAVAVGRKAVLRARDGKWYVLPDPPRALTGAIAVCKRGAVVEVIATGGDGLAFYDVAERKWTDQSLPDAPGDVRAIAWVDRDRYVVVGDRGFWAILPR